MEAPAVPPLAPQQQQHQHAQRHQHAHSHSVGSVGPPPPPPPPPGPFASGSAPSSAAIVPVRLPPVSLPPADFLEAPGFNPGRRQSVNSDPFLHAFSGAHHPRSFSARPHQHQYTHTHPSIIMSQQQDYKFEGWNALDKDSVKGNMVWKEYEPKAFADDDVDIKIMYCGVCASDIHTISGGWGDMPWPVVTGHELLGEVVRVGSKVTHVKVGDIAGVGAQNDSCLECDQCLKDREPYCNKGQTGTYAGKYYREGPGKGAKSYGGYANYHRAPGHFVIAIPDGLDHALAAPMLCGGVTVYSPLVQYGAGKEAKDVGIVGIGGLGHFGLLFAKALGANVTAISHSESKKADAEKMGATRFIATHSGKDDDFKPYARSLDLIVATTNDESMPLTGYLSLLRPGGHLILVGAPEKPLPAIPAFPLILSNVHIAGSAIGSPKLIKEMLELAAKQNVKSWIEKRDMKDANQTVIDMKASKARYRYVLVNTANGGKL